MADANRQPALTAMLHDQGVSFVVPLHTIRVLTGCCLFVMILGCSPDRKDNKNLLERMFSTDDPSAYSDKYLMKQAGFSKLPSVGPYKADTTFADENSDSVTVQLSPFALVQIEGKKQIKNIEAGSKQPYILDYKVYCLYDNRTVEHLEVKSRCEFVKTVRLVNNYAIDLKLSKGEEKIFERTLTKDVFNGIVEDFALRRSVIVGLVVGPYNTKHKQLVVRIRLAESYGSNWWIETYVSLDLDGKIKLRGLVDYSPDCNGGVRLSADQQQLITCSEIADYQGSKIKLNRGNTTLVHNVSQNIYAVAYNLQRKQHIICDTTINLGDEIFTLKDYDFSSDTVSNNVFVLSSLGDTLAMFYYHKSISEADYAQHFAYNNKFQSVGFYNNTLKTILYIPVGNKDTKPTSKPITYRVAQLQQLKDLPKNAEYLEFVDPTKAKHNIRFYIVDEKIYAYAQVAQGSK